MHGVALKNKPIKERKTETSIEKSRYFLHNMKGQGQQQLMFSSINRHSCWRI